MSTLDHPAIGKVAAAVNHAVDEQAGIEGCDGCAGVFGVGQWPVQPRAQRLLTDELDDGLDLDSGDKGTRNDDVLAAN